ncbi:MAG: hypothetical protein AAFP92_31415, partial [Bacteroidota bacterium]
NVKEFKIASLFYKPSVYNGEYTIDYVGMDTFIAECDDFAQRFGPRFEVPQSLRDLAAAGKSIHEFQARTAVQS